MKTSFVNGSSSALAMTALDTSVSFLLDRRQTTALAHATRQNGSAYVWRRVFLRGKRRP